MAELSIYTDGGCSGNPGPGGWGYAFIDGTISTEATGHVVTGSGGEKSTTNNRMELTAVIQGLTFLQKAGKLSGNTVSVYTDSQYVQKGITQWITGWKRNGWKTASKQPVKNQDLWIQLDFLVQQVKPRWVWVKGHAGIEYNELVDQLTQLEIAKFR